MKLATSKLLIDQYNQNIQWIRYLHTGTLHRYNNKHDCANDLVRSNIDYFQQVQQRINQQHSHTNSNHTMNTNQNNDSIDLADIQSDDVIIDNEVVQPVNATTNESTLSSSINAFNQMEQKLARNRQQSNEMSDRMMNSIVSAGEPQMPGDEECCGRGCTNCVYVTYAADLAAYQAAIKQKQRQMK